MSRVYARPNGNVLSYTGPQPNGYARFQPAYGSGRIRRIIMDEEVPSNRRWGYEQLI